MRVRVLFLTNNAFANDINILNLIDEEKKNYNNFVGDNPEVLLRTNLDISLNLVNLKLKNNQL
jgi:hypothetical protein